MATEWIEAGFRPIFPRIEGTAPCEHQCGRVDWAVYRLPNGQRVCLPCWNTAWDAAEARGREALS